MFGRKPFQNISPTDTNREKLQSLIDEQIEKAINHYGDAKYNASTWACLYALAEEKFTNSEIEVSEAQKNSRRYLEEMGWTKKVE